MAKFIHATAVALRGRAVLIRGPSGSGKSDLALRCMALSPSGLLPGPVMLVADDQVAVEVRDGRLIACAPAGIAGKLEIRGLGIRIFPYLDAAEVVLAADLVSREAVARYPDPPGTTRIAGLELPMLAIHPFDASAPIKLMLALIDAA